jgi:hypothetical protein
VEPGKLEKGEREAEEDIGVWARNGTRGGFCGVDVCDGRRVKMKKESVTDEVKASSSVASGPWQAGGGM